MVARLKETGFRAQKTAQALVAGTFMRLFHQLLVKRLPLPTPAERKALQRRFDTLLTDEIANVRAGHYPAKVLFQANLLDTLRALPDGLLEMPRVILRARKNRYDDLPNLPELTGPSQYPRYYRRNFHWQSDGWLSDESAKRYDAGVDLLFGGTTDIMRRMIVPDLAASLASSPANTGSPRVLDIATGTGRFLEQLHLAVPDARLCGLDLSPHYLEFARTSLAHLKDLSLVAENAEAMPFADQTFDAVSSVFLFHELPSDARRNVVREALRVVRPGGLFAVLDSAQLDTSADIAFFLESFPKIYHEPYFKGYLRDPLPALLTECGFDVVTDRNHFVSRAVIGRRPMTPHA